MQLELQALTQLRGDYLEVKAQKKLTHPEKNIDESDICPKHSQGVL